MRLTSARRTQAHRLLLCAVLALAPLSQAVAEEGTKKWLAWQGRESDGWDFSATDPVAGAQDGQVTYVYSARRTKGEGERKGKLEVFLFGHRLKGDHPIRAARGRRMSERFASGQIFPMHPSGCFR